MGHSLRYRAHVRHNQRTRCRLAQKTRSRWKNSHDATQWRRDKRNILQHLRCPCRVRCQENQPLIRHEKQKNWKGERGGLRADNNHRHPREETSSFKHLPTESGTLHTGDYAVLGLDGFCVERKSLAALANCLRRDRERFENQCRRMQAMNEAHLVIIGLDKELAKSIKMRRLDLSQAEHTLLSFRSRYGFHIHHVATPAAAALKVETLAVAAWHNALRTAGINYPFPSWAECGILPRFGEAKTAAQVIDKMLEWKYLPSNFSE